MAVTVADSASLRDVRWLRAFEVLSMESDVKVARARMIRPIATRKTRARIRADPASSPAARGPTLTL